MGQCDSSGGGHTASQRDKSDCGWPLDDAKQPKRLCLVPPVCVKRTGASRLGIFLCRYPDLLRNDGGNDVHSEWYQLSMLDQIRKREGRV